MVNSNDVYNWGLEGVWSFLLSVDSEWVDVGVGANGDGDMHGGKQAISSMIDLRSGVRTWE